MALKRMYETYKKEQGNSSTKQQKALSDFYDSTGKLPLVRCVVIR
jgi:hypothetical protein